MKTAFGVFLMLGLLGTGLPARAQDEATKLEVYGGYDYIRFNINANVSGIPPSESVNLNGGSGQVEYNLNNWAGVVGDFGGYYGSAMVGRGGAFSYLFGPRVNLRRERVTPFAQVLLGGIATTSGIGQYGPQNHFALAAGGGLDWKLSPLIAIRPVQAEYFLTTIPDGLNNRQNSFRFSTGIVFRFGRSG
jgi:outer membrane immunogenic protein